MNNPEPISGDVVSVSALRHRTVITVEEAGAVLGIGRSAAYEAARRGDLPTLRIGRRLVVPTPALLRMLGAGSPETDAS